jgi:putative Mg2+ transporter-C (MgtC) family protein
VWEIFTNELTGTFSAVHPAVAAARLTAALVLGAVIGFEREWRSKPAGLRTHMMVAMAAALFIVVSQQLARLPFVTGDAELQVDPLRLVEAVTAGVAFLAAGVIFTSGGRVRNLKTGASMWLAGAIGLACGAGQVPLAAMAAAIVVVMMTAVRKIEKLMGTYDKVAEDVREPAE